MREHQFWRLIAEARHQRRATDHGWALRLTDSELTAIRVRGSLEERPAPEVIRFHHLLARIHRRAYRWDVWTAFGIALGGIDDMQFGDAITWLILRGKRTFRNVLVNPDALATMTIDAKEVAGAEKLTGIAHELLEPPYDPENDTAAIEEAIDEMLGFIHYLHPPPGESPARDLTTLRQLFPRLTERYDPAESVIRLDGPAAPVWARSGRR